MYQDYPNNKTDAESVGSYYYFTGKLCKRGHVSLRYTRTRNCETCVKEDLPKKNRSEKARLRKARYRNSDKGKASILRWNKSEKCKNTNSIKERALKHPNSKIAHVLRTRLNKALRKKDTNASGVRLLGCTVEEFKLYCQQHVNWRNSWSWKDHGLLFHIDHIKPLASFNLKDKQQLAEAAHYTNLQPLEIQMHKDKTRLDMMDMQVKRNGACLVCEACGSTTGCS